MAPALVTTSLRLEADLIERIDRLAELLSARAAGATVNRSAATRVVIERGVEALEKELARKK